MIIGIDLGTTKSAVGIWQDGEPVIIPALNGQKTIPSQILVTSNGQILAGNQAKNHPERYQGKNIPIESFKRWLGREHKNTWGFWRSPPQEVAAFVLRELTLQTEKYLHAKVEKAVIAIPSHFDVNQRQSIKEAAIIAGIQPVRLLNEATAVVLAYAHNKKNLEKKVVVFDFGGGTLDVSVVDIGNGVFEILCIEGDSLLGGIDFDQVIVDYVLTHVKTELGSIQEWDPIQKMIVREAAEQAKINLSSSTVTQIFIPGFLKIGGQYRDLCVPINRETFEKLSHNLIDRALAILSRALETAKLKPSELDSLLLIGGCSRIPIIQRIIKEKLKIDPIVGVDPEICVAQGATIQAAILMGEIKDILLLETTHSSYGIGLKNDKYEKIIKKNTTYPVKQSKIFTTSEKNQSIINVPIYQGENPVASKNTLICNVEIKGIPPALAGVPKIELTLELDPNMILIVSAKDLVTKKEQTIVVRSIYSLSKNELEQRIKKFQEMKL